MIRYLRKSGRRLLKLLKYRELSWRTRKPPFPLFFLKHFPLVSDFFLLSLIISRVYPRTWFLSIKSKKEFVSIFSPVVCLKAKDTNLCGLPQRLALRGGLNFLLDPRWLSRWGSFAFRLISLFDKNHRLVVFLKTASRFRCIRTLPKLKKGGRKNEPSEKRKNKGEGGENNSNVYKSSSMLTSRWILLGMWRIRSARYFKKID